MTGLHGTLAPPADAPGWVAAGCGVVLLLAARSRRARSTWRHLDERAVVALLAVFAAVLSAGYVVHYLRGGPRIIDATSYFLQGRALSEGHLAFEVPEPSGAFRGRFLVRNPNTEALGVLFPPGYAAVLSLGFLLGAPMAVGPVIAAALVGVTHRLARSLFGDRDVALLAAALSVSSATLRYHTADTMSHGWAALAFAGAVVLARHRRGAHALSAGVLLGWLVATRPVTGAVAAVVVSAIVGFRSVRWVALGMMPGACLLLAHQHAATGQWLQSTQLAYYAVADGPPGCFRYGFGEGIGCQVEHGDFVRHNLPHGYDARAAVMTTLRRLHMHLLDAANFEPWALLLPVGAFAGRRLRAVRLLAIAVLAVVVAYAPFYFDGNYPGGGARILVDALPFEHVLLAWTLTRLRLAPVALPMACFGFAVHGEHDHIQLAEREGGRPMFEPAVVYQAGVERGLVLVDTDHGFNLGFDPEAPSVPSLVVARRRRDDHDVLLWRRLGEPQVFAYEYSPAAAPSRPRVVPLALGVTGRFEMEAEWPPLALSGGWVRTEYAPCASAGRALGVVPMERAGDGGVTLDLEVGVLHTGTHTARVDFLSVRTGWEATLRLGDARWSASGTQVGCLQGAATELDLAAGTHRLRVEVRGPGAALDVARLTPLSVAR